MGTTSPLRIDDELYASAKLIGGVMSRSAAQQIAHWALIGRELESSREISTAAVTEVLAGRREYDSLTAREQAIVRAGWTERAAAEIAALNLEEEFTAEGRTFVELDDDGNVVEYRPGDAEPR